MALSLQELFWLLRSARHLNFRLSQALKCHQLFVFAIQFH